MLKPVKHGLTLFSVCILIICSQLPSAIASVTRPSITFVVGEDSGSGNTFLTKAAYYYTHHPRERTDSVETFPRSLLEIRNHLEALSIEKAVPWGIVNIVGHGNQWTGLSLPVFSGGERTTTRSLQDAVKRKRFQPLPDSVVDEKTEIRILGCALGKDADFLRVFRNACGGDDDKRPMVRASRYFVCFDTREEEGKIVDCVQYAADYWFAFYRKGYRPGDIRLARQLKNRYPNVKMDWRAALKRSKPRFLGDTFHHVYHVPIKWIVVYADTKTCPDMSTRPAQERWLHEQQALHRHLHDLGIPAQYFAWHIKNIKYSMPDGTLQPAVRASGKCAVLCILKALTETLFPSSHQSAPLKLSGV